MEEHAEVEVTLEHPDHLLQDVDNAFVATVAVTDSGLISWGDHEVHDPRVEVTIEDGDARIEHVMPGDFADSVQHQDDFVAGEGVNDPWHEGETKTAAATIVPTSTGDVTVTISASAHGGDGSRAGLLPMLPQEDATRLSDAFFENTLVTVGYTDNTFLIAAADWETFEPRWSRSFCDSRAGGRPTVADGIVAVPRPDDRAVVGLDFETGETEWRAEPELAPEYDDLPATLVAGADEFFGVLPGGGVFSLDPATGTVRWEFRTDAMSWSPTSGVALAGDLLVVTGSGGKLFAIS